MFRNHSNALKNILAISIAILPINLIMIWYRLTQTENFSTVDMTVYPLLFGGGSVVLILWLNKYLLRASFRTTFNSGESTWGKDVGVGLGLTAVYFTMFFVERATLMQWLPNNNPPNTELINVMVDLAHSPLLMVVWFGPVLWLGIALFEELSRTFLLKCLWNISENRKWHIAVIFLASTLIGLAHLYQGVYGIISIGLKSVVVSLYFYKYRRLLPLIISHGLYDGLQFAFFVIQFQ